MHFVIDAQLPPKLVHLLLKLGHTAEHVFDRFSPNVSDKEIWQYSLSCGAVIITKDDDFQQRVLLLDNTPQVLWLKLGNTSNRALFELLMSMWPEIECALQAGERIIEVI